ncbi:hypothetical protein HDU97_009603 [Phlyctochytrium planicorne]|nr:hypothetical protein HDU97_009603 [Phlyctochytrium planicorne]
MHAFPASAVDIDELLKANGNNETNADWDADERMMDDDDAAEQNGASEEISELLEIFQKQFKKQAETQVKSEQKISEKTLQQKIEKIQAFVANLEEDCNEDGDAISKSVDEFVAQRGGFSHLYCLLIVSAEHFQKYKKAHDKRCSSLLALVSQYDKTCELDRGEFEAFMQTLEKESLACKQNTVEVFRRMSEDIAEAKKQSRSLVKKEFNARAIKEGIILLLN